MRGEEGSRTFTYATAAPGTPTPGTMCRGLADSVVAAAAVVVVAAPSSFVGSGRCLLPAASSTVMRLRADEKVNRRSPVGVGWVGVEV